MLSLLGGVLLTSLAWLAFLISRAEPDPNERGDRTVPYWAETEHLGLDDDGLLWLIVVGGEDDRPLGPIRRAELPEVAGEDPDRLEGQRGWLVQEWDDAPGREELRAEARAAYYGGLRR